MGRIGSQRRVFVVGPFAVKLPRLHRLRAGARANREEARIWREGWQDFYPELCPVWACLPLGVALVMPAVRILTAEELESFPSPDYYPDPHLYEDKEGEWGYFRGRVVVVDYAARAHRTPDEMEEINSRVRTIDDVRRTFGATS